VREAICIGGGEIKPGQRLTVDLPIARLYTRTEMTMPVHVVHGKRPGPKLFVSAAIHGDEINGVEIIRRLLKLKLINKLHGTLIAIPTVNVYGFINRSRYLPDRRDLNRCFPGSEQGSLASRLANLFMAEIVEKCTHGIDIHTGSDHRVNLPQIRSDLKDPENMRIAQSFGAPVIIDARVRDGSLREAVAEKGIPMLLYEGGETLRFSELAIRTGLKGVVSVMREIGLLQRKVPTRPRIQPIVVRTTKWVRAPISGIHHSKVTLGTGVSVGQVLGLIGDPFGETEEKVLSPIAGVVIGRSNLPLVHRGDALCNIASVEESVTAQESLEAFELSDFAEAIELDEVL
jgi:predicted deacylase